MLKALMDRPGHPPGVGTWLVTFESPSARGAWEKPGHTALEAYNKTPLRTMGIAFNDERLTFKLIKENAS